MYDLHPRVDGPDADTLTAWHGLSTSALGHLTHEGYLAGLHALHDDTHLCGPALTVEINARDSRVLREALIMARADDVLVIQDHDSAWGLACWGELRALAGCIKRLAGVVVVGHITDVAALRALPLPTFYLGVSALTIHADIVRGTLNGPLSINGVGVRPGDMMLGDDDGLFALTPERAVALLPKVVDKEARDARRGDELRRRWRETMG